MNRSEKTKVKTVRKINTDRWMEIRKLNLPRKKRKRINLKLKDSKEKFNKKDEVISLHEDANFTRKIKE